VIDDFVYPHVYDDTLLWSMRHQYMWSQMNNHLRLQLSIIGDYIMSHN